MTDPAHSSLNSPKPQSCDVLGHAWLSADAEQLANLRRSPGPGPGQKLAPSFLKHADEQTVTALAAVCHAIHEHDERHTTTSDWTDWGVIASSRYFSRAVTLNSVKRFLAEGSWGMSPNLIPHRSLHSPSGTISQALKAHGPNFGAGSVLDTLYCAAGLLAGRQAPGIWVVLTAWEPEPLLDDNGNAPAEARCTALALALTPPRHDRPRLRINLSPGADVRRQSFGPILSAAGLHELLNDALNAARSPATIVHPLDRGGHLEITSHAFAKNYLPAHATLGVAAGAAEGTR